MGLSTFEPEVHPISFNSRGKEQAFTVRGLTLVDISYLVGEHIADIDAAYEMFKSAKDSLYSRGGLDSMILMFCKDAPGLVAEVISVTADEPTLVERYAKLPFSVSALALAEIIRMTLEEQGGLKNLSAALARILKEVLPEKMRDALGPLMTPELQSDGSIGESGQT